MTQHLRIARPVTDIERAANMYCQGLTLGILGSFRDHDGFDGIMVGAPGRAITSNSRAVGTTRLHPVRPLKIFWCSTTRPSPSGTLRVQG